MHGTPNLPRFLNACQGGLIVMSVWRIVMKNSCIYEIRYVKLIHESDFLFKWKIRKKEILARHWELEVTSSSQQKPVADFKGKHWKRNPKQDRAVSSICSINLQYHEDWTQGYGQWEVAFDSGNIQTNGTEFLPARIYFLTSRSADNLPKKRNSIVYKH